MYVSCIHLNTLSMLFKALVLPQQIRISLIPHAPYFNKNYILRVQ